MELLSGYEKIITKSGISLNAGTLNRGFTVNHKKILINSTDILPKLYNNFFFIKNTTKSIDNQSAKLKIFRNIFKLKVSY
jgi:hypothetical protein